LSQYTKKARLVEDISALEQYDRILAMDKIKEGETHWNSLGKNTLTLIQVLIDKDLIHLVMVLEKYPQYIEAVCEHFRYAYSYSENEADLVAASTLLDMGKPYYTKQFVRNVVRKLPKVENDSLDGIKTMSDFLQENQARLNPILLNHYAEQLTDIMNAMALHPLQKIAIIKGIQKFNVKDVYDYHAEDRDAALDIPYMN
jgi:hypothetical protein